MKYKVGDKVRVRKDLKDESYYGGVFFNQEMKEFFGKVLTIKFDLYDRYGVVENNWYWSDEMLEPVANRSKVGKKAYKTFLKNGGSRDSKGRFCGPITLTLSGNTHIVTTGSYEKQKIDWEIIGSDLYRAYMNTSGTLGGYNRQNHAKAYAKVFQKHGLISKEIEI